MTTAQPCGTCGRPPEGRSSSKLALDDATIDAIARRVADLLADGTRERGDLVDAATLARLLGISRGAVYANAAALGAVRLGDGPKARLRFDVERARAAMTSGEPSRQPSGAESPTPPEKKRGRRRSRSGTSVPLLPIDPSASPERQAS